MFYALSWFVVVASAGAVVAGRLGAACRCRLDGLECRRAHRGRIRRSAPSLVPDWLAPWVPPEVAQWASQLLAGLAPLVDGLLQAAPALAGGLTVATWVIWGIGSVLLVLLGAGLHLLIALWRRRAAADPAPAPASLALTRQPIVTAELPIADHEYRHGHQHASLAILTLSGRVTFHAWRLGNEKRDVALLGVFSGLCGAGTAVAAIL